MFVIHVSVLQEIGSQILNEKRNFTPDEYQQMFNQQLQVELTGSVKIKSIEKFSPGDDNVLLYVSLFIMTYPIEMSVRFCQLFPIISACENRRSA